VAAQSTAYFVQLAETRSPGFAALPHLPYSSGTEFRLQGVLLKCKAGD